MDLEMSRGVLELKALKLAFQRWKQVLISKHVEEQGEREKRETATGGVRSSSSGSVAHKM